MYQRGVCPYHHPSSMVVVENAGGPSTGEQRERKVEKDLGVSSWYRVGTTTCGYYSIP